MKPIVFSKLRIQTTMLICFALSFSVWGQIAHDSFDTGNGKLDIYFIGHGTLMFDYNGYIIHIDPVGQYADYTKLPKADLILITHEHGDHVDAKAQSAIEKSDTKYLITETVYNSIKKGTIMKNGDMQTVNGIKISAVPAYNITSDRQQFHPKGQGNGYILQLGNKQVYVAGDTENIPEMKQLKNIDIAFLPVNQPYTMTPEQAADAAKAFKPKVLYPYHYGNTNIQQLVTLLKDEKEINVRIRQLQ